ncbi:MAG: putative spermidine/putrescine transport system permease protein, partial [Alphaproteobacteria bacterium]|nr:putative spermidine/putrescine transport system permease protein [Alphaproteobacteria bacterium]
MPSKSANRVAENALTAMARPIPLVLASLAALFLVAPMAIIVPMSFSSAISFEFPPPGYWTGYYVQYFSNPA